MDFLKKEDFDPYSSPPEDPSPSNCDPSSSSSSPSSFQYSWVIAVCLCVLSAFIINFGTNLQKLAWNRRRRAKEQQLSHKPIPSSGNNTVQQHEGEATVVNVFESEDVQVEDDEKNGLGNQKFRRLWVLGFICIVVGSIFDFAALGFGAQSIVAPLGSVSLVANMGFAQTMHGEKLSKRDILATAVIFLGCVLSVAFASHENTVCDVDSLMALYGKPRFYVYALCVSTLLIGGVFAARYMDRVKEEFGLRSTRYMEVEKYHRFCLAFLSGISGAQSVLFAKSLDELLVSSFSGDSKIFLAHIGSYLIAAGMFCSVGLQLFWMNVALSRWDALYVVPVFQSNWIVFSVIGGGVFYGEFAGFSFGQSVAFLCGVSFTVLGVYFLSQREIAQSEQEILLLDEEEGFNRLDNSILSSSSSRRHRDRRKPSLSGGYDLDGEDAFYPDPDSLADSLELGLPSSAPSSRPSTARSSLREGREGENLLHLPLLSAQVGQAGEYSSAKSFRSTSSARYVPDEYDVVFTKPTIGLSVEPCIISSRRPASSLTSSPSLARTLKFWRVRATRLGASHPVKIGHVIVAVNDASVVGPGIRLPEVLDKISNGSRPIKIRFRVEPSSHQPFLPRTASFSSSAQSSKRTTKSSSLRMQQQGVDVHGQKESEKELSSSQAKDSEEEDARSKELQTEGSDNAYDGEEEENEGGDSEEESEFVGPSSAHSSLHGVSFNPLLELLHTWKDTEPSAYDKMAKQEDLRRTVLRNLLHSDTQSATADTRAATVDASTIRDSEPDVSAGIKPRAASESHSHHSFQHQDKDET